MLGGVWQSFFRSPRAGRYAPVAALAFSFFSLFYAYSSWIASFSGNRPFRSDPISPVSGEPHLHPIVRLHRQALADHERFLQRQSQSLADAAATYLARYEVDPPAAFEAWFNKARELQSPIIDDFDNVYAQVGPFTSAPLNDTAPTKNLFVQRLLRICVTDHVLKLEGFQEQWFFDALDSLTQGFIDAIPDVCLYMNALDEPRAIPLPYGSIATEDARASHYHGGVSFFTSSFHTSLFTEATLPCLFRGDHPDRADVLRGHKHSTTNETRFADDFFEVTDLCNYNRSLTYGLISSPETASFTHDPVPILSNAKLSTISDILFPSLWRYEHANKHFDADFEPDIKPWSEKSNTIFWRGSTTGGHGKADEAWHGLHRQDLIKSLHELAPASNTSIRPDVGFTDFIQCDAATCEAEKAALPTAGRVKIGDAWAHKFLLDMDGNGLSGRLYDLLGSNSVVVRHTMLREWHDERLRPWLHFVPLTPGAPELGELLEFFGTAEGDAVARTIAEASRKWAEASLRREDQQLYFWRILLEAAGQRRHFTNVTTTATR